jgi:branched-chain amino acid transport system substrate-binding protein
MAAFLLAVAACADAGGQAPGGGAPAPSEQNPATGSEIVLGLVNPERGEHAFPEFREGVEAAVKYLNEEAGGISGHRIRLATCRSDGEPQGSIRCANEVVGKSPIAVIGGEDRSVDSAFPIYEQAGVPYISPWPVTNQQFVSPVAVSLNPGIPGVMAALAKYSRDTIKASTASLVVETEIPRTVLDQFVGQPFKAAGIDMSYVFYPIGSPDLTTTMASAAQRNPDVLLSHFDLNQQCVPAMTAMRQMLDESTQVIQTRCNDDDVIQAAGPTADGELFYVFLDSSLGLDTPDARVFRRIMKVHSKSGSLGVQAGAAVSSVLTLKRVLEKSDGDQKVTRDAVLPAFAAAQGVNMFMGAPLACGAATAYPALCTQSIRLFTAENGTKKPLTEWFDGLEYLPR